MVSDLEKRELFDVLKRVPCYTFGPGFLSFATAVGSWLFGASIWRGMAISMLIAPLLYGICLVFWEHCVKRIPEMTYEIESELHAAKLKHRKELVLENTLDSLRSAQVYEISSGYKNIRACFCAGISVIVSITLQQYVPLLIIVFIVFATRDDSRLHKIIIHVHLSIIADEKDALQREKARKEWQAFRETPEGKDLFETGLATSAADLLKFTYKYKANQKEFEEVKESSKPNQIEQVPQPQNETKHSQSLSNTLEQVPPPDF